MKTSPFFEKGSENNVAIVLSCPGKKESCCQKPAAGSTGDNYKIISDYLRDHYCLDGFQRSEITITNSWNKVEYSGKGGTGRSEAKLSKVMNKNNLSRLAKELENINKYIICCGINAKKAISYLESCKRLKTSCHVLYVNHLGNQALNKTIKKTLGGLSIVHYAKASEKPKSEKRSLKRIAEDNRLLRLQVVVKQIADQIKNIDTNAMSIFK